MWLPKPPAMEAFVFLSKPGNVWCVWFREEATGATGKKKKVTTGFFRKSDALKYLASHSLTEHFAN
jgi:hypothetical protein